MAGEARAIVFAAQDGFNPGGRLEARLGTLEGSHVAIGGEYMASVGADGYFRLGWATQGRTDGHGPQVNDQKHGVGVTGHERLTPGGDNEATVRVLASWQSGPGSDRIGLARSNQPLNRY